MDARRQRILHQSIASKSAQMVLPRHAGSLRSGCNSRWFTATIGLACIVAGLGIFATGVAAFNVADPRLMIGLSLGEISLKPDPLLQVMPQTESLRSNLASFLYAPESIRACFWFRQLPSAKSCIPIYGINAKFGPTASSATSK